jgi:hypothetical protein
LYQKITNVKNWLGPRSKVEMTLAMKKLSHWAGRPNGGGEQGAIAVLQVSSLQSNVE